MKTRHVLANSLGFLQRVAALRLFPLVFFANLGPQGFGFFSRMLPRSVFSLREDNQLERVVAHLQTFALEGSQNIFEILP